METTTPDTTELSPQDAARLKADRELIDRLGGTTKVARMLCLGKSGAQRVSNWRVRGIPSKVKLDHPKVFLAGLNTSAEA